MFKLESDKYILKKLTWVSVKLSEAASPALSELDRYLFMSNVDSNWNTWNIVIISYLNK